MTTGIIELKRDEITGRIYWHGHEDGWMESTELGNDGVLMLDAKHFEVGTKIIFEEPHSKCVSKACS